jgi:hypothetical protein
VDRTHAVLVGSGLVVEDPDGPQFAWSGDWFALFGAGHGVNVGFDGAGSTSEVLRGYGHVGWMHAVESGYLGFEGALGVAKQGANRAFSGKLLLTFDVLSVGEWPTFGFMRH